MKIFIRNKYDANKCKQKIKNANKNFEKNIMQISVNKR